jgi:hypothetical protein
MEYRIRARAVSRLGTRNGLTGIREEIATLFNARKAIRGTAAIGGEFRVRQRVNSSI